MKNWKTFAVVALLAGAAIVGTGFPLLAEDDEDHDNDAANVASLLAQVKVSLADAAKKAEAVTGGQAIEAELELDDGVLMYEIIVVVPGDKLTLKEVEIDAKTGKVLEEDDDDDDEDDHDDEDDDDDDHDDD